MIQILKIRMKPLVSVLLVTFLAFVNLSMTFIDPTDILTEEDLHLENEFGQDPAIHTMDNRVESYLKWTCFPALQLARVACLDEEGNEPRNDEEGNDWGSYDAVIVFETGERTFYFEAGDTLSAENCHEKISSFTRLLKRQYAACMYAAQWPPQEAWGTDSDGKPIDYFVAYGFKTANGRYLAPVFDPDSEDFTEER